MSSQKNQLFSVGVLLKNFSLLKNPPPAFILLHLNQNWNEIGGSIWKNVARPVSYKDKTLTLKMESSCHLYEARFQTEELIKKINKYFKIQYIQKIKLTI